MTLGCACPSLFPARLQACSIRCLVFGPWRWDRPYYWLTRAEMDVNHVLGSLEQCFSSLSSRGTRQSMFLLYLGVHEDWVERRCCRAWCAVMGEAVPRADIGALHLEGTSLWKEVLHCMFIGGRGSQGYGRGKEAVNLILEMAHKLPPSERK